VSYSSPSEIFEALAKEMPGYRGLDYAAVGDQGTTLGGGEATRQ
jgi:predicted molibdopterin-dependent oxidoreductase YjgC